MAESGGRLTITRHNPPLDGSLSTLAKGEAGYGYLYIIRDVTPPTSLLCSTKIYTLASFLLFQSSIAAFCETGLKGRQWRKRVRALALLNRKWQVSKQKSTSQH